MRRILFEKKPLDFNITGVIDIVFLLIIFFMVVCRFIPNNNFDVAVPDDVSSANRFDRTQQQNPTVTVMNSDDGTAFAVDAEIISVDTENLADAIAGAVNRRFGNNQNRRIVSLRIDKDVSYKDCQYALAGISRSKASGMELAVVKDNRF